MATTIPGCSLSDCRLFIDVAPSDVDLEAICNRVDFVGGRTPCLELSTLYGMRHRSARQSSLLDGVDDVGSRPRPPLPSEATNTVPRLTHALLRLG